MDPKKPQKITLYEDGTITICPRGKRSGALSELQLIERQEKMKDLANKKKTFQLNSKQKRSIRCSGIRMFRQRKNTLKWFCLTFPSEISQKDANKCLSKFVENLKENYYANSYLVVKENTKRGRPHFHCIVDMPFKSFKDLNVSWCNAYRGFCDFSPNALTTGRKNIIEKIEGVAYYVTKYITKAQTGDHLTRIYFNSQNIDPKPRELNYNEYIYLTTTFQLRQFPVKRFTPDGLEYICNVKILIENNFTIMHLDKFNYLPEMFYINLKKPPKIPKKPEIKPDYIQQNFIF